MALDLRLCAVRHLYRPRRAGPRFRLQPGLDGLFHPADLGRAGPDHPDLHLGECFAGRGGARGRLEQPSFHADGGGAPADVEDARNPAAASDPARAPDRHQRLGRGDAAVAGTAARAAHRVLQRACERPDRLRVRGRRGRLLPGGEGAGAVCGRALVPHAALHAAVDHAQQPRAGRPPRAGARARDRPGARPHASGPRPDVERPHRRHARVSGAPAARGAAMSAVPSELWPYLALILVGFLPNEGWGWLGLLVARGLDEDSEIVLWARGVATAILAAVMAQLIATNSGVLATTPLAVRIGATAAGILAF